MGNAESGAQGHSDDEEGYNYHQAVLKQNSAQIQPAPCIARDPEDEFHDAREHILENEDMARGENSKESTVGSEESASGASLISGSSSGSNISVSGSNSGSNISVSESSSSSSKSESEPSPGKSSDVSTGSLPNRIRVIDSDSEDEDEVPVPKKQAQKHLDFSTPEKDKALTHRNLPRPIPIHKTGAASTSTGEIDEEIPGRSEQVKRKADDMEPEPEDEMSVPVRSNGGPHRPFGRRKELRDHILKPTSTQPAAENKNSAIILNEHDENRVGAAHKSSEESEKSPKTKFEHSNTSPFKNFHLQPSSSSAGADLSASAETPKDKTKSSSPAQKAAVKRPNQDADPSTSTSGESNQTLGVQGQTFTNASGSSQGTVYSHGFEVKKEKPTTHWTSELPRVNVAASEKRYQGVSRASPMPSTSDLHNTVLRIEGDRFSFLLADSLNVHICYDDVTKLRTDALVNPTDGQLTHVNDIAKTIATATGPQMTNQCQFFLRQNKGPLEMTEVIETYACGSLSGKVGHVVHVAAPTYEAANEKNSVNKLLNSYLNCLRHINDKLGLVSVVFPCIGTGSYPQDTCINVFFEALLIHLAERKTACIKTVKFVFSDIHLGNLAIAMVHAHLERSILEGFDVLIAEALNSYYGNCSFESAQNDQNDQIGRQMEVDSPKKLFRGPPVKRPKL